MKKFNIILMLLLMFFVTGCGNKKFDLYQGSQDIKITRKSDSGTARINISDTYKKGGEKYFIFTTDIGEQEFTLSEKNMMNISEMAMMLLITRHIICNWKHHFTNTGRTSLPVYIPIMITR